jgi:hypothetical protein
MAGPEGYIAENIPVYGYSGIIIPPYNNNKYRYTGYMGVLGGARSVSRAWGGAHLSECYANGIIRQKILLRMYWLRFYAHILSFCASVQ